MSKPSAPAQPDYKGAAEATAASQRVNQYTPYGSIEWSQTPAPGVQNVQGTQGMSPGVPNTAQSGMRRIAMMQGGDQGGGFSPMAQPTQGAQGAAPYSTTIKLNPQAQQTLDTQLGLSNQMANIAQGQLGGIQDQYSQPMDLSSVPQIADRAYETMTSRLDPRFQREEDQLRTRLANQGLSAGGEAYNNEMMNFNQGKNDAYQQANLGAIGTMPQTYQLATSTRNQPLNEFNSLRTGAQIQNPQFTAPGAMPSTNYLGAAQAQGNAAMQQYGADVGSYNAMAGGLFGLGSAGIGAYGLMNRPPFGF